MAQTAGRCCLILQGMDAAGQGTGPSRSICDGVNPQGCEVHFFQATAPNETRSDFMWRHVVALRSAATSHLNASH